MGLCGFCYEVGRIRPKAGIATCAWLPWQGSFNVGVARLTEVQRSRPDTTAPWSGL